MAPAPRAVGAPGHRSPARKGTAATREGWMSQTHPSGECPAPARGPHRPESTARRVVQHIPLRCQAGRTLLRGSGLRVRVCVRDAGSGCGCLQMRGRGRGTLRKEGSSAQLRAGSRTLCLGCPCSAGVSVCGRAQPGPQAGPLPVWALVAGGEELKSGQAQRQLLVPVSLGTGFHLKICPRPSGRKGQRAACQHRETPEPCAMLVWQEMSCLWQPLDGGIACGFPVTPSPVCLSRVDEAAFGLEKRFARALRLGRAACPSSRAVPGRAAGQGWVARGDSAL